MKRHYITAFTLIITLIASAQRVISLDECKELALKNNIAIRNSSLQSEIAKEVRREAFTMYFPQVSAEGFAFTTNHSVVKYDIEDKIDLPPFPGLLPDGLSIPIDVEFSMIKKGVMAGANLVQPVFMGGMIVNGNKLAGIGEAVAELQSRQSQDQVRVTVEQYYWQLASLKSKRNTVNQLMAMLDTLERQVNVAVDAGVVLRNELLEVQLRRNEMETARIELDNGISVMALLLGQYIGCGIEPIDIPDEIRTNDEVKSPLDLYVAPSDALYSTIDYQLLQQNVKASDLEHRLALGENLPKVGVGAGYFYQNLLDQGHGFGAIYAMVSVPISGWWGGSHSMKQSKLKAQIARNQLEDYSELLQVKMNNAWDGVKTAYEKIGVARQSIEQASENLRLNENYYKAGTTTVTDLLKAQTLYLQSHNQYVEAFGNYMIKTTEYLLATGR